IVPVLGIVLASRRRENPIGWMFLAAGAGLAVGDFGGVYGVHALVAHEGPDVLGRTLAWLSNSTWVVPFGMRAFLFLLFPTGNLPSPRWRTTARVVGGGIVLVGAASLLLATQQWHTPYALAESPGLFVFLYLFLVLSFFIGVAAVVVRYRGSSGDERLQLKWFATAAVLLV